VDDQRGDFDLGEALAPAGFAVEPDPDRGDEATGDRRSAGRCSAFDAREARRGRDVVYTYGVIATGSTPCFAGSARGERHGHGAGLEIFVLASGEGARVHHLPPSICRERTAQDAAAMYRRDMRGKTEEKE
jgi:hypothetical protein